MWTRPQLLVLLCVLPAALGCDWLREYRRFTTASVRLLRTMDIDLTDQDSPVPFPYDLYDQIRTEKVKTSQVVFIRDALRLVSRLIKRLNVSEETNSKLETLRGLLYRQGQDLKRCVPQATNKRVDIKLKKYFKRLQRRTLASWPLLLRETLHHLLQLDLLVVSIYRL